MSKYLYGVSVQGIQGFIFATNQLQEVVGASEIVKSIEEKFRAFANYEKSDKRILLNAAGNVKALFDDKESCEHLVKSFAKYIQQEAYGITVSQALVEISGEKPTKEEFRKLDNYLKIQRNKPSISLDFSLNIMELNPKTSKPIYAYSKRDDKLDKATFQKREAYSHWFNQNRKKDKNFKALKELSALSNGKNKLAVIHADGNGLGTLVLQLGENLSAFSVALDEATRQAFEDAKTEGMKIREVILGGDDLTVICDANEALGFTQRYLENFEKNTAEIKELSGLTNKLTACAGISYTNEKYPFHYAVDLAEALCKESKNHANRVASCVMFHNIQSSNFQKWSKFVDDELTISNDEQEIRCDFGPYYLGKKDQPLLSDFINSVEAYRCDGSPISRLRNWMSELNKSHRYSENLLKRINTITQQSNDWNFEIMDRNLENLYTGLSNETLIVLKDQDKEENDLLKTPVYDILQILSVTEGK
ncbi:MAG TPA: hypothetical protein ENK94_01670 [Campylobacterales bacterium]|nr:hypothetical protein [Campylobacterales bacterium]